MPKYSIIVSVYNIEKYLKQCVDSILKQTITDFELILVDDGSKDDSGLICDNYADSDNRITVLHKENGGLSDARNTGLLISKGDYIFFVDGDDWIEPNILEEFNSLLSQYGNVDFIHGRYKIFYSKIDKFEFIPNYIDNTWAIGKSGQEVFVEAYKRNLPIAMGIRGLYNRDFLIRNNLFFEKGLYAEDAEWTPRLFFAARNLCGYDGFGYIYRANRPDSLMNTLNAKKLIDEIFVYDSWIRFIKENDCSNDFKHTLNEEANKRVYWLFVLAVNVLNQCEYKQFISIFKNYNNLICNWGTIQKKAGIYKILYDISIFNDNLGFFFIKIYRYLKKVLIVLKNNNRGDKIC